MKILAMLVTRRMKGKPLPEIIIVQRSYQPLVPGRDEG